MKKDGKCPKCDSRRFYKVESAKIPNYEYSNSVVPLTIAAAYVPVGKKGFFGIDHQRIGAGLEAWVCASCSLTELYCTDLDVLEQFAEDGHGGVTVIDYSTSSSEPYK